MNKRYLICGLLLGVCGCETMNHTERCMLGGGVIGTGIGTVVGAATGRPLLGAAIGAAGGTAVGGLAGAAHDRQEDRAHARAHATAQAIANQQPPVTVQDVVTMTQQHLPTDMILRQIETTNSYYNLTVADITYLRQSGVSDQIIGFMQGRRRVASVQQVHPVPGATRVYHVYEPYRPAPAVSFGFGVGGYGPCRHRW